MSTESYKTGYIDGAAAELNYKQRCEQLEQLCRDLWELGMQSWDVRPNATGLNFEKRMDALGLLEGESNASAEK